MTAVGRKPTSFWRPPRDYARRPPDPRHDCNPKARYPTQERARERAFEVAAKLGRRYRAYECRTCGYWHVGRLDDPWHRSAVSRWYIRHLDLPDLLGDRVTWCLAQENTGPRRRRRDHLTKLGRSAERKRSR